MRFFLLPLMLIAGLGLALSLLAHLFALTGSSDRFAALLSEDQMGQLMTGMTLGIFVVWAPAVLIAQRINNGNRLKFSWKKVLAGCPIWMSYTGYGLFAYAIGNFFLSISHEQMNDQQGLRAFSGHWMMFYGLAFCIFYSSWQRPFLLRTKHCPAGHEVAHDDEFCSLCGLPTAQSGQDPL